MYQRLLAYKAEHGHNRVPRSYTKDLQLGTWVSNQSSACTKKYADRGTQTSLEFARLCVAGDGTSELAMQHGRQCTGDWYGCVQKGTQYYITNVSKLYKKKSPTLDLGQ